MNIKLLAGLVLALKKKLPDMVRREVDSATHQMRWADQGSQGAPGPRGETGPMGKPGPTGETGQTGPRGERGLRGYKGLRGLVGKQGPAGQPGAQGDRGPQGEQGEQGGKGDRGEQGEKGDAGPIPRHKWTGTKLQFEKPDGTWGKAVDLQGAKGDPGGGSAWLALLASDSTSGSGVDAVKYARRIDVVSDTVMYKADALPGSAESAAAWRISRITTNAEGDVTEHWAGGAAEFDQVWDDRLTLSYS